MRRIFQTLLSPYNCIFFKTLKEFSFEWSKATNRPTLLLADLSLPDGSFLKWMEENQNFHQNVTCCIVISGQQDIGPMRASLDLGAFDYIVKPFVPAEVQIKVERILNNLQLPLILDPTTHSVSFNATSTTLTSKQFQILSMLHASYPVGITREDIQTSVWQNTKVNQKNLTVHLSLLRTKLKDVGLNINHQKSTYVLEPL
ncbi:MAG: response regulator transcription factor [Chitinophagaceae bacterium]|nr:response regulator transcription factor [Oligoflexus sp.]